MTRLKVWDGQQWRPAGRGGVLPNPGEVIAGTGSSSALPLGAGQYPKGDGSNVVAGDFAADVASVTVVSRLADRLFDARNYAGFDYNADDNLDPINAALADAGAAVAANGGHARVVLGAAAKTVLVKPSKALNRKLILPAGVTLDLSDVTLKVADDADAYDDLITGDGTTTARVRITGGAIDTNALGHVAANIGIGSLNKAYAVRFLTFLNGLTIDGVTFYCCGINTVVVNGANCHNIVMERNNFEFKQGATTTPDYDNSACYLVADDITFANNRGYSTIDQEARALVEIHGPNAALTGNRVHGFQTLANLVTPDFPYPGARNNITVTGNTGVDANQFITLWPVTGDTLRGVVISSNTIHLAQINWNQNSAYGISRSRSTGITGDVEGYTVKGNIIFFQPGDTRTVDENGVALNYTSIIGIGLGGGGTTRHAQVEGNTVFYSPQYGIRVGIAGSGAVDDAAVRMNTIVDAGQNPNLPARFAFAALGTVWRSEFFDNKIDDTGPTALNGQYSQVFQVSGGGGNRAGRNLVSTASGLTMSTSITNADTYIFFGTRRATALTFSAIAAGAEGIANVTVKGAAVGDNVIATPTTDLETTLDMRIPRVTSTDTVTIRLRNNSAASVTPVARNWDIRVIPKELTI